MGEILLTNRLLSISYYVAIIPPYCRIHTLEKKFIDFRFVKKSMASFIKKSAGKSEKVIYWIATSIVFLLDSAMPAFTFNTELAKEGIRHLGYPDYFRIELSIAKIIGGLLLILPMIPVRYKEWAYVGFGIDFISAFIGHLAVDGFDGQAVFPLVMLMILVISYIYFHKLQSITER